MIPSSAHKAGNVDQKYEMATKKKALNEMKSRIKNKLKDIEEQAQKLYDAIDAASRETSTIAKELLEEKNKNKFFNKYSSVNQRLENHLEILFLIRNTISSLVEEDGSESTSESEEDDEYQSPGTAKSTDTLKPKPEEFKQDTTVEYEEKPKEESLSYEESLAGSETSWTVQLLGKVSEAVSVPNEDESITKPCEESKGESLLVNLSSVSPCGSTPLGARPRLSTSSIISTRSSTPSCTRSLSTDIALAQLIWEEDKATTVIVTEIKSPWDFYIQVVNPMYDNLMEELCLFFSKQASQGYKGGINHVPVPGCYCCAKSPVDSVWYRAKIINVKKVDTEEIDTQRESETGSTLSYEDPNLDGVEVKVYLVDEGVEVIVPLTYIRPLERRFIYLPCQAIRCMLGGVLPKGCRRTDLFSADLNTFWSEESTRWFSDLVKSDNTFTGYLHRYDPCGADVALIDLYADGHVGIQMGACALPPVDCSLSFMMLMVQMADRCGEIPSHLDRYKEEVDGLLFQLYGDEPSSVTQDQQSYESTKNEENFEIANETSVANQLALTMESPQIRASEIVVSELDDSSNVQSNEKLSALSYEDKYKRKKFETGSEGFARIVVSEVVGPDLFYVHLITPDVALLDQMMDELNDFYDNNSFKEIPLDKEHLEIGDSVIAKYSDDNRWYRGVIMSFKITDEDTKKRRRSSLKERELEYEVLYIDFGSKEWVKMEKLRPVKETFFELPIETLPCCLADVDPIETERISGSESTPSSTPTSPTMVSYPPADLRSPTRRKPKQRLPKKLIDTAVRRAAGDEVTDNCFLDIGDVVEGLQPLQWPEKASSRFKELALNGKPLMACLKDGTSPRGRNMDDPFPIYLYDTTEDKELCINELLVDEGFAVSRVFTKSTRASSPETENSTTKIVRVTEEELEQLAEERKAEDIEHTVGNKVSEGNTEDSNNVAVVDGMEVENDRNEHCSTPPKPTLPASPTSPTTQMLNAWDPMRNDYLSERNAYSIDTDDPGVATLGYAEPQRNICKYYLSRKGCYRGNSCPYEHVHPDKPSTGEVEVFCDKVLNTIDLPEVGAWVVVQVTSCFNPFHFWIRFPLGVDPLEDIFKKAGKFSMKWEESDELDDLQERMKTYSKMVFSTVKESGILLSEGELLAARYSKDGNWYRAKVILALENQYQVFFVDYGDTEMVKEEDTRKLLPEFLHLDFQAVEAFMANTELDESAVEEGKLEEAISRFEKLTVDKLLVARIMSKAVNKTLYVDLYDTSTEHKTHINSELVKNGILKESEHKLDRPWDMEKSLNSRRRQLIPG